MYFRGYSWEIYVYSFALKLSIDNVNITFMVLLQSEKKFLDALQSTDDNSFIEYIFDGLYFFTESMLVCVGGIHNSIHSIKNSE